MYQKRKTLIFILFIILFLHITDILFSQDSQEKLYFNSEVTVPAKLIRNFDKKYPDYLKEQGVEGIVKIDYIIDEQGNVIEPTVVKASIPFLTNLAMYEISRLKYTPASLDGTPVKIKRSYEILYTISENSLLAQSLHRLGNILESAFSQNKKGDPQKVVETLKSTENILKEYQADCYKKANALLEDDDKEGAEVYLRKSTELDYTAAMNFQLLASVYLQSLEDTINATCYYELALSYSGNLEHSHGNLGWCYFLIGEYDKSIMHSQYCVELNPDALYARFNTALAYLAKGEITRARELYKQHRDYAIQGKLEISEGVYKDLADLINKKIYPEEAGSILKDIFSMDPVSLSEHKDK